ncbi:MAG: Na-K-Cl cotransporter [Anaerolineales bacterium]|nr:Na-K-Cl cotransporter [Anaerolineales bacterium]
MKQALAALTNSFKSNSGETTIKKFGTFGGVFTPNVLTILGVIMYLRLGWVVGNAGILGAVIIILMAKTVTICTGLSMSSITTNIKIGAGGAYSIISKSLGLEAGGSVGIPFYIAQTLSAALYIIGFTEGWLRVFPDHIPLLVSSIAWISLLAISYISADLAIKVQYLIMAVLAASIVSFLLSPAPHVAEAVYVGNFERANFWVVYAIFFPAVTGIMAGANMSGDLQDPRRSIPIGTMSSIVVTMIIYISMAVVVGLVSTPNELLNNQMVMVDKALWGPVVLAGIMGATLSSALGSMLGAPRLLQALAEQRTAPFHKVLAVKTASNEPRNAIIVTGIIIEAAILLGNLDALAVLITMFFLITYGMLNLVVFLQQSMQIISFRPTFKVPRFVSLFGAVSCAFMMFLINPVFSFVAISVIIIIYIWLTRKGLDADFGDIRGGLFLTLAERAARLADKFPDHQISWKPDLLVPIKDPKVWAGSMLFIRNITYPSGSIFAFTVKEDEKELEADQAALTELLSPLKEQNILVNSVVLEDQEFLHGAKMVIQTLRGGSFRPNTLFMTIGGEWGRNRIDSEGNGSITQKIGGLRDRVFGPTKRDDTINQVVSLASKYKMGVILLRQHPRMAFGVQKNVNLWLRDKSPNWHLAILIALQLQLNWGGKINLVTVAENGSERAHLHDFLQRLSDQARLPSTTEFHILSGPFKSVLDTAPRADLNIFGLSINERGLPLTFIRDMPELVKTSCVFVIDSGHESALV